MPLLHIVALRFKAEFSKERIAQHFEEEVNLKGRMPELVAEWSWRENVSLQERKDVNGGCNYVVLCKLYSSDPGILKTYLEHPEHKVSERDPVGSTCTLRKPTTGGFLPIPADA